MIALTLPYPPTMNMYWRNVAIRGKPRTLISADGRNYKTAVAMLGKKCRARPLAGPLRVVLVVYRPRRIGDLDNVLKPVLDALKGIAFEDDSQVTQLLATRCDDKENPRVEVKVWPMGEE